MQAMVFRAWGCAYVAGRPWAEGAGGCDGFFATSAAQLPQVGQPGGPQRGFTACEAANCAPHANLDSSAVLKQRPDDEHCLWHAAAPAAHTTGGTSHPQATGGRC